MPFPPSRSALTPVAILAAVASALALLVALGPGVVAHVDGPVDRWTVAHRTGAWTAFFRFATHLGDPGTMFGGGVVLTVAAALRSRRVAFAILAATVMRPLLSSVVKRVVDRPRPQLAQLVTANDGSFPSGHTLGACVLWGCVPLVLMAWAAERSAVRASVLLAGLVVLAVAASRVYLGVHWFTDVLGGALIGLVVLTACRAALGSAADRRDAVVPTMDR